MGSVSCGQGAEKENSVTMVLLIAVTAHRLSYMLEHKMTRVEPGLDASFVITACV